MGSRVLAAPLEERLSPGLQTAFLGVCAAGPGVRTARAVWRLPLQADEQGATRVHADEFPPTMHGEETAPRGRVPACAQRALGTRASSSGNLRHGEADRLVLSSLEEAGGSPSKDSHV